MNFNIIPAPKHLRAHVECFRVAEHAGTESMAITVCLNGLPGLVFQHHDGQSPIEQIVTTSRRNFHIPTLYVYGQTNEPGVMHHKKLPSMLTQVILKPHALQSLLGLNASVVTNTVVELNELSEPDLNDQLLEAKNAHERVDLLTRFLTDKLRQAPIRDCLVEEGLKIIQQHRGTITVKDLLERLNISERQFEKRFRQTVGIAPQFYIRIKRFNAAIRLMKSGRFERLTDVAHALNYYDQSHFIRDIKAFSGTSPKSLAQKVDEFHPAHPVYAYV